MCFYCVVRSSNTKINQYIYLWTFFPSFQTRAPEPSPAVGPPPEAEGDLVGRGRQKGAAKSLTAGGTQSFSLSLCLIAVQQLEWVTHGGQLHLISTGCEKHYDGADESVRYVWHCHWFDAVARLTPLSDLQDCNLSAYSVNKFCFGVFFWQQRSSKLMNNPEFEKSFMNWGEKLLEHNLHHFYFFIQVTDSAP